MQFRTFSSYSCLTTFTYILCHFLLATIYSVPPLMLMSLNVQFAILLAQIEGICVCSWFLNQIYLLCEHVRKTTQKTWEITAGRILGFLFPQRFDCYDKLARSSQWRATRHQQQLLTSLKTPHKLIKMLIFYVQYAVLLKQKRY